MKPILFNTEMVQAILDGRKTVTRRCIKREIHVFKRNREMIVYDARYLFDFVLDAYIDSQARYKKGDILYVTETWKVDSIAQHLNQMLIDFKAIKEGFSHSEVFAYFTKERFSKFKKFYQKNGWQSPYFMPKEAARLFLRITDVRIERLQDITESQAMNEGAWTTENACPFSIRHAEHKNVKTHVIAAFAHLWDSTIKKAELGQYGWDANPCVFVYEFEVISKEEAMKESDEK